MNILNFLRSRIGAINKIGLFGLVSVGAMGTLSLVNYVNSSPAAQEQKIRSLASIMAAGQELPREYSGINIDSRKVAFATPEEIAKIQGESSIFDGGEGQERALEGFSVDSVGNIRGSALGAGETGLGLNTDKGVEGAGGQVAFAAQRGSVDGVDGAAKGAEKDAAGSKKLKSETMARYSGATGISSQNSGSGNSFGPSGSARSAAQEKANRISPADYGKNAGMLPGSGPLVARSKDFEGAHAGSSSFLKGGRDGRVKPGVGIHSAEGDSLRLKAKKSADVAANASRAANEGGFAVFMNGEGRQGITFEDGMVSGQSFGGVGDDSFKNNLKTDPGDMIGQSIQAVVDKEAERKSKRSSLGKELIGMLFATIAAMIAISALMQAGEAISKALAAVIACIMWAWIATYMARAGIFARDYDNDPIGILFACIAGIFAVGIAISFIPAVASGIMDKIVTPVLDGLGIKGGASGVASLGISPATQGIDSLVENSKDLAQGNKDESGLKNS